MSRLRDEIHQLTARLTTDPMASSSHPRVVVLLMGHLPVRAGLWRLPAARHLLPDAGKIVVARCDGDELFIECIGDVGGNLEEDGAALLERLPVDSTLVLVPASGAGTDAIVDLGADRVALVTGGDQAATAGAYRMLKSMAIPLGMEIDLVVAGSEGAVVEETASRLGEAVARHLGMKLRFIGAIPKIEADTGLTRSAAVPCPAGGLPEIARRARRVSNEVVKQAAASTRRAVSAGAFDESTRSGTSPPPPMAPDPKPDRSGDQAPESCARLFPAAPTPQWRSTEAATMVAASETGSVETRQQQAAVPTPAQAHASSLSAHLPELHPLPVQCPDHDQVELAVDDAGTIHLLVACPGVVHVPIVLAWIERHRSLLQMALPKTRFDWAHQPVVHVLGEDVETLCSLRKSSWRPHLLVRVDRGGPTGWASVPLSED